MGFVEDTIESTREKEQKLIHPLDVKSRKVAELYLTRKHTQLSYLAKEEQDFHLAICKGIILDGLILYLSRL